MRRRTPPQQATHAEQEARAGVKESATGLGLDPGQNHALQSEPLARPSRSAVKTALQENPEATVRASPSTEIVSRAQQLHLHDIQIGSQVVISFG